ncbi:PPE family protein [Mycobacterium haemophilum DSM 44634]|uniref:PPE family protein n=1 Tax=Mycobacterium haemophilum TaxID=29311 RepID=UPI0006D47E57|nr:PPE family protein [Mycobacterium haemophilum]ALL56253.1 hypothetical protein B586_15115 [Mycobacterium haemophilum DSM 44634]
MRFDAFPPEDNARDLLAGPGVDSMMAAAREWDRVVTDLKAASTLCQSLVLELLQTWQGGAAMRMHDATTRYQGWLNYVEIHASLTLERICEVIDAYEDAVKKMVPLAQIAHNRAWRAELLTSNTLGQNTRALEACDTVYQRFWVTNAEAMNDYADTTVRVVNNLHPWPRPPAPLINETPTRTDTTVADQAAG